MEVKRARLCLCLVPPPTSWAQTCRLGSLTIQAPAGPSARYALCAFFLISLARSLAPARTIHPFEQLGDRGRRVGSVAVAC
ncbi:hypothetical protein C2845_PM03G07150 [Panicum miliaceum]|uniref:Uncharacterized protein n=1 Tax=Panicum miliaceum TaxID=4540 RepID=A0A3L6TAE3_PANMI|nr:hypothetical protein C2845_PM03G07150 [Panicum miliaceum]